MLLRFDPFDELDRLVRQATPRTAAIPMDAYRHGDHLAIHLDLPGVDPESIDVTVEKNVLTVTADRRWVMTGTPTPATSSGGEGGTCCCE